MKLIIIILFILFGRINLNAFSLLRNISLQDAERISLQNNKPFLIANEDVYQANQRKLQAYSKWFPNVKYYGMYTHTPAPTLVELIPSARIDFTHNTTVNKFELLQPLLSTELFYNLKSKSLEEKSSEEDKNSTKNSLLFKTRNDYFLVVFYEAALDIQRENVQYLTAALKVEQGKFNTGDSTTLEVNQSKVAVANSLSEYYGTLQKLKEARHGLIITLGVDPILEEDLTVFDQCINVLNVDEIKDKLQKIKQKYRYPSTTYPTTADFICYTDAIDKARKLILYTPEELRRFLDVAYNKRPDLKAKRLNVDIANQQIKQKRGNYFPEIAGFVDYQKNGGDPTARFLAQDDFSWSFGIRVSWNIFDSFLREREIKEAVSKRTSSKIDYDYAMNVIEVGIRNQLYQIEDTILVYLSSSEGVMLAEQAMIQAKEKLQYGKIPPLEYRDASNQLAQARNLKNKASYELMMAYYKLRFDMGVDSDGLDFNY